MQGIWGNRFADAEAATFTLDGAAVLAATSTGDTLNFDVGGTAAEVTITTGMDADGLAGAIGTALGGDYGAVNDGGTITITGPESEVTMSATQSVSGTEVTLTGAAAEVTLRDGEVAVAAQATFDLSGFQSPAEGTSYDLAVTFDLGTGAADTSTPVTVDLTGVDLSDQAAVQGAVNTAIDATAANASDFTVAYDTASGVLSVTADDPYVHTAVGSIVSTEITTTEALAETTSGSAEQTLVASTLAVDLSTIDLTAVEGDLELAFEFGGETFTAVVEAPEEGAIDNAAILAAVNSALEDSDFSAALGSDTLTITADGEAGDGEAGVAMSVAVNDLTAGEEASFPHPPHLRRELRGLRRQPETQGRPAGVRSALSGRHLGSSTRSGHPSVSELTSSFCPGGRLSARRCGDHRDPAHY